MSFPIPTRVHATLVVCLCATTAAAEDSPTIQDQLEVLRRQNAELGARLDTLEQRDRSTDGGGNLRLTDLSLDVLMVGGGSTATDAELSDLQGGGHDPKRRGFTFQGAELSIAGAVDPYFAVESHLVATRDEPSGSTGIEVEEAFARTTSLPAGLEGKLGLYLLEFGRFNPTHPHAWQFIDQPIIVTRVFGGDGQRTPGARLLWSLPTTWLSELIVGASDANGETAPSFLSEPGTGAVGGRPYVAHSTGSTADLVYNLRWTNAVDVGDAIAKLGLSAATGPNAAGDGTRTRLWGADAAMRWHPAGGERGWPFVLAEAEYIGRTYQTDAGVLTDASGTPVGSTDATTLHDQGFVIQTVYGFHPGWAAGLRGEYAWGSGDSVGIDSTGTPSPVDPGEDPYRDRRTRVAALLSWQPSEFSHFRLQWNHDRAEHLDHPVDSVWLGAEFLIGAHPAHTF